MNSPEDNNWMDKLLTEPEKDGLTPAEFIRRKIRVAIQEDDPNIDDAADPFVVFEFDGIDGTIVPAGSFKTSKEALRCADEMEAEMRIASSDIGSDVVDRFRVYTADGILVNPPENEED